MSSVDTQITFNDPVVLGVVGSPDVVAASLSPAMFAAAFVERGIRGYYVPLAVRARSVRKALRSLPRLGFRGVNVTMPYKQVAAEIADTRSELVEQTGVANTLVIDESGAIHAEATDGIAVTASISECGVALAEATVTIIGAGGAAIEAAWACAFGGAGSMRIWSRDHTRSAAVAEGLAGRFPKLALEVCGSLPIGEPAHVLVSAVPAVAYDGVMLGEVWAEAVVLDLAYRPDRTPTPLTGIVRERGQTVIDGRQLLVRQGAVSYRHWFAEDAPTGAMLRAVT